MDLLWILLLGVLLATGVVTGMALATPSATAVTLHQLHLGPYKERCVAVSIAVSRHNRGWHWTVYYLHHHASGPGWILHVWKYS